MKSKFLVTVCVSLCLLLAACGDDQIDSTQQEQAIDTQEKESDKEKIGGVFDVQEGEEQEQDENFIAIDLTMDNVNDYIDFVEYNNSYAIISKQFDNGLVFWAYSGDFNLSYTYTLEVDGEQRELKNSMLDLNFNHCIEANTKPVITDVKGSISFVNVNRENVKCEYKDNMRYVEVDGEGHGDEIIDKELFELHPY